MTDLVASSDSPGPGSPGLEVLLAAVQDLAEADDLEQVLPRVVTMAARATGARYAALGVIDEDDPARLSMFITHGIDERTRARIGSLPSGRGVLGRLISDPRAVRLSDIASAPDSVGMPPGHPPMATFLGMPVRVADRVFGNLYLTEKEHGAVFTQHDEDLLQALATIAGSVIDTAQQREALAAHRSVVESVWEVHESLSHEQDLELALPLVIDRLVALTGAVSAAVLTRGDPHPQVVASSGQRTADLLLSLNDAIDAVLAGGAPVHRPLADARVQPDEVRARAQTSVLPVRLHSGEAAVLVVAGWRPRLGLGVTQVHDLLTLFTTQVALVLDFGARDRDRRLLSLLEDRDRIARDLHDLVIQRLFAVGLQLQGAGRLVTRTPVQERLHSAVTELDATIRDIRATIFELHHRPGDSSLRADLRELIAGYGTTLGFAPVAQFDGPLDTSLDDDTQVQVLAVLREALSNVVRHARATSCQVQVLLLGGHLVVQVDDDGVGVPDAIQESGIRNVRERATAIGGSVTLTPRRPRGTSLRWQVPVASGVSAPAPSDVSEHR